MCIHDKEMKPQLLKWWLAGELQVMQVKNGGCLSEWLRLR